MNRHEAAVVLLAFVLFAGMTWATLASRGIRNKPKPYHSSTSPTELERR